MTICAFLSASWTFPSPTVFLILDGFKEMQTRNDSFWHVYSSCSGINIEIDLLIGGDLLTYCHTFKILSIGEQRFQKCLSLLLLLFLLCLVEFRSFYSTGSSLIVSVENLILDTLNISKFIKKYINQEKIMLTIVLLRSCSYSSNQMSYLLLPDF